ncbi:No apical meristem-associated C-terminal domain containing protein [Nitzschia inconspicua]|uniref:No apical meristem-associated C-terminal domain containing protein n=1 Tax=Nitzschia inconspicua TaxID=303405 RepID=A0A9K3PML4_9STRA|nr:No apical meristem-associated C-terminal domain containing protein [Nitzschia inconspicua]
MATRPKNFTPIEDVMLCRAYVNATLNPITGTDQKMEVFWRGIKGKFDELYAEADEVQEGVARAPEALMNRYMRKILPEMNLWIPFYKRVSDCPPSGVPKEQCPNFASEAFFAHFKRPFRFPHVAEVLMQQPKFDPMSRNDDIEELLDVTGAVNQFANGKSTTNTIGKPMGSKIPRPIGQKAAKRKAQEEISVARSQKTRTASMVQMTAIHERLAKSMEDNNQIDIRYKEFQMLKEIGDVEGSRKCIEEIQQLKASIDGRASASIDCRASFSSGSDEDDANDSPMVPVVVTAPAQMMVDDNELDNY